MSQLRTDPDAVLQGTLDPLDFARTARRDFDIEYVNPETLHETLLVYRANLIQEHDRIDSETAFMGSHEDLGWAELFLKLGGNCGNESDGAVPIGDVVLQNERWPSLSNFGAQRRVKVDQVDVSSLRPGHT